MQSISNEFIDNYLERLRNRPRSKSRNYLEELALPYLKHINWSNETFENDIKLFWISVNRYWKHHIPNDFIRLMDWVKKKNSLHPLAVVKLLNKK